MNSQWLGLHAQDLHKIKPTKFQYGLGRGGTPEAPLIASMPLVIDSYRERVNFLQGNRSWAMLQYTVTHP